MFSGQSLIPWDSRQTTENLPHKQPETVFELHYARLQKSQVITGQLNSAKLQQTHIVPDTHYEHRIRINLSCSASKHSISLNQILKFKYLNCNTICINIFEELVYNIRSLGKYKYKGTVIKKSMGSPVRYLLQSKTGKRSIKCNIRKS